VVIHEVLPLALSRSFGPHPASCGAIAKPEHPVPILVVQNVHVQNCEGATGELDFLVVQTERILFPLKESESGKKRLRLRVVRVVCAVEVKKRPGDLLNAVFKQQRLLSFWKGSLPEVKKPLTEGS